MKRILILRESLHSKLALSYGEEYPFQEIFNSVSVDNCEIVRYNIENVEKIDSFDV